MSYKIGDIVLIRFPFTNLAKSKKRPVLIIKNENELNDIVCFQITSNDEQLNLLKISNNDLANSNLTLDSYIKYDKCFTLNTDLLKKLKILFCKEIF